MKSFRTVVVPVKPSFSISHTDSIVSIGSCFSENIGKKFSEHKFNININPFGQQYNPYSIANAISRLLTAQSYSASDLVYHDELYHSFDHHGSFSASTADETLAAINSNLLKAAEALKKASVLFLTFGTSHVFSHRDSGKIVSNCHKLSGNHFNKRLLTPDEIVQMLDEALSKLLAVNPQLRIVLTVSPVRYFAFGHYENSVSKAHLFTALHRMQQQRGYYYFPAYELVMDDLRDYRFFAEDMLHPNYQATEYVWESICNTMLSKETLALINDIREILRAAKHKPRNPQSDSHKKFVKNTLDKMAQLQKCYALNFENEKAVLAKYL